MSDDPIQRFTQLLLIQAHQDRAKELVVAPAREPSPIRYKVDDAWHDLFPPPAHILPGVIAELGRLANFARRPFPKEGLIDVPCSTGRSRWIIRMASVDSGCILTPVEQ